MIGLRSDKNPAKISLILNLISIISGIWIKSKLSVKISCPLCGACWNLKEEDKALAMEDAGWSHNGLSVLTSVPLRISIVEPFLPPRAVAPVTAGYPDAVTSFPPYPYPLPSGLRHPHKAQHAAASSYVQSDKKKRIQVLERPLCRLSNTVIPMKPHAFFPDRQSPMKTTHFWND